MDRAEVFDEDAELYDRARPGYPDALFVDLLHAAGLKSGARVLELGPGTGQATRSLVGHGLSVTAVERGPALAEVLRTRVPDAEVVTGRFETWPLPDLPFDAVVSFTAWHWLDPVARMPKAHKAIRPGGSLATTTTSHVLGGTVDFFVEAQACYERWDPATPAGLRLMPASEVPPEVDEVDRTVLFDPPIRFRYEQEVSYPTRDYLDLLMTYSGHRALEATRRAGLLRCLADLIDRHYDGVVAKRYLYELRVARRSVP